MNYETKMASFEGATPYVSEFDQEERRKRRWLIIGLVLLAVIAIGTWIAMRSGGAGDDAKPAKQAPSVTVMTPGKQLVENRISATGTLAARREMPVGAVGEGGMVTRVLVEPGAWVQAGQVLAVVDRQVQAQQSGQLASQIQVAQADARLTQNDLQRAQALAGRGFISKAEIDRKTAQRDAAAARVRVAQAQFGENRARMGRLDIRAPAAGLVLTRAVEPGQVIGAGTGVLFRIARGGEMELKAALAESDLQRLTVGMSAQVTPVGTANAFNGQIWQIAPIIDPQTRQGVARVALAYNRALRPGGFAAASITSGQIEAPMLPESAVQSDEKGNYVYIVGGNNKVAKRYVTLGTISDAGLPILGGLAGDEKIVVSAGAFLNPDQTVIPVAAKKG